MGKASVDMLSGSITKSLLRLSIPIMIMNVMQSLFNIIDMTVLGKFADDTAVGAVGACGTLISLCTGLLIGIAAGANIVVARRIGEGDREHIEKTVGSAVMLAIVGSVILLIVGVVFAEDFLRLTNCPESLLPMAVTYFTLYFCGAPMLMLYNFFAAILRATGDTKRPMYFLLLGGAVKIVLNIFFIRVLHTTVEGVAISTIISNSIAGALCFMAMQKSPAPLNFKRMRFYASEVKEMLFVGIPAGLQTALYSLANVVITTAVNGFGADATTGVSIANQFDNILYQITYAPSLATTPFVAQNIGAGNIKRVKKILARSVLITALIGGIFGSISAIFSAQLSSMMTSTPAVISYSQQKMIIISSTYFLCGINEIVGGVMRGLRRPILPTISTLVFMCLLRFVWVYGIFPLYPSLTFLYLVWPIGWISSIILLTIPCLSTISKMQSLADN